MVLEFFNFLPLEYDFYTQMKLINFIRTSKPASRKEMEQMLSNEDWFTSEKFLKPVIEDDALLFGTFIS